MSNKEEIREQAIYELALKIADVTVATKSVSSRILAAELYNAGYRLHQVDAEKLGDEIKAMVNPYKIDSALPYHVGYEHCRKGAYWTVTGHGFKRQVEE